MLAEISLFAVGWQGELFCVNIAIGFYCKNEQKIPSNRKKQRIIRDC